jgi:hypothetical protein
MRKMQNILIAFLELLGVKHTKSFSGQYYNEHPHKYNLWTVEDAFGLWS